MEKSKKKIWRVIPLGAHKLLYTDRMRVLEQNFSLKNEFPYSKLPLPETDFETKMYGEFFELIKLHYVSKAKYVVPLIKEFVIDNEKNEAAVLFRYQMGFEIDRGFQMKEIVFYAKKGQKLKKAHEAESWVIGRNTPLFRSISVAAKTSLDPMLYLLKINAGVGKDVDFHGLEIGKVMISICPERGEKIFIEKP